MKIPESPPIWIKEFRSMPKEPMRFFSTEKGRELLADINDNYLHWEKVKYSKLPENVDARKLWAFVKASRMQKPRDLPLLSVSGSSFSYTLPDSVHRELHLFDRFAGGQMGIETPEMTLGGKERYLVDSLMEEAIASSQLEGAVTTRKVAKEMLRTGRKPRDHAEVMILNNYRTIHGIKKLVEEPLSIELLHFLQESMTKDTLDDPECAGRFRRPDEEIHVVDQSDGKSLHIPPDAKELNDRVQLMCDFANNEDANEFTHPILKAVLLHFWLAYDHPYVDGNGRTARALFYWYIIKKGYWLMEFLSISKSIVETRRQYYRSFLYAEGDGNDATYFVVYHLKALNRAMEELKNYIQRKQKDYNEILEILRGWRTLNYRQQALLRHALNNPLTTYTIQSHKNSHNIAYGTARSDLQALSSLDLLIERKVGKRFVFTIPSDISEKISLGEEG